MTVAQLETIVTLLRSRPQPETPDVGQSRARYEKLAVDYVALWMVAMIEKILQLGRKRR